MYVSLSTLSAQPRPRPELFGRLYFTLLYLLYGVRRVPPLVSFTVRLISETFVYFTYFTLLYRAIVRRRTAPSETAIGIFRASPARGGKRVQPPGHFDRAPARLRRPAKLQPSDTPRPTREESSWPRVDARSGPAPPRSPCNGRARAHRPSRHAKSQM